jgi:hypothetical protein
MYCSCPSFAYNVHALETEDHITSCAKCGLVIWSVLLDSKCKKYIKSLVFNISKACDINLE